MHVVGDLDVKLRRWTHLERVDLFQPYPGTPAAIPPPTEGDHHVLYRGRLPSGVVVQLGQRRIAQFRPIVALVDAGEPEDRPAVYALAAETHDFLQLGWRHLHLRIGQGLDPPRAILQYGDQEGEGFREPPDQLCRGPSHLD